MEHEDIVKAVRAAIVEERKEFWIPGDQHFLDHQLLSNCREHSNTWRENHEFVEGVREGFTTGKKVSFGVGIAALTSFIIGAIWLAIKEAINR